MAAIGRILLMSKGAYSGSAIYNALDWVRDNGAAWVCMVDGTQGIAPPTLPTTSNANWTLLAADGSVSGAVDWTNINNKPFSTVDSSDFDVDGSNELNIKRGTFGKVRVVSGSSTVDLAASGDSIIQLEAGSNVTLTPDNTTNPKKITINSTGGGGGTSDYADLINKPSINGHTLSGNQTGADLGLASSSDIPTVNNGQLTIQQNGTNKATFTANQSANATANIITDTWTATATVSSSGTVSFSGLNDSYGYKIYYTLPSGDSAYTFSKVTKTGSGTSVTLTYTTDAPSGTVCKLRILK